MSDDLRTFRRAVMTQAQFMMTTWYTNVVGSINAWDPPSGGAWVTGFWIGVAGNVMWAVGNKASWGLAGIAISSAGAILTKDSKKSLRTLTTKKVKDQVVNAFQKQHKVTLAKPEFQTAVQRVADELFPKLRSKRVVELPNLIQKELRARKTIIDDMGTISRKVHLELRISWLAYRKFFPTEIKYIDFKGHGQGGSGCYATSYRHPTRMEVRAILAKHGRWVSPTPVDRCEETTPSELKIDWGQ